MATRRDLLQLIGAGGASAGMGGSLVHARGNVVTITSPGGKWELSIREHFIPHFKKKQGPMFASVLGALSGMDGADRG